MYVPVGHLHICFVQILSPISVVLFAFLLWSTKGILSVFLLDMWSACLSLILSGAFVLPRWQLLLH